MNSLFILIFAHLTHLLVVPFASSPATSSAPPYTCTLIHPLRLLILACTRRVALLFISMHSLGTVLVSILPSFTVPLFWTRIITIKFCSISKSCANDSVLLDHVEYHTIVLKCSRLTVFFTPKRNRVARGGFHLCMYVYSVRAVFNKCTYPFAMAEVISWNKQ